MPVRESSNSRILPANARAVDVATKAIDEILPVQQRRYMDAFRVQGFAGILYNRLLQGRKCTCSASQKYINTRLGVDGKASAGTINQLITGDLSFDVSPYGSDQTISNPSPIQETSSYAPENPFQGVFDVVADDINDFPNARVPDGPDFGDNGPIDPELDIESLVGDFDASHMGFSDVACCICYGTSYVGGYAPFNANRQVVTVTDVSLGASTIDATKRPFTADSPSFTFTTVLPYGAVGVDIFRVMNNAVPVPANFTIDGSPVDAVSALNKCDGQRHTIGVTFSDIKTWTHMEIQFSLSTESAYFEFPKLSKGNDTSLLEQLEPFQIVMSPNVPSLRSMDVIVESTFGKVLVVQNSNWWNTRNRNVLGWECQVRVIQPQEFFRMLPKRGRIQTKNRTPDLVHDNVTGNRRT